MWGAGSVVPQTTEVGWDPFATLQPSTKEGVIVYLNEWHDARTGSGSIPTTDDLACDDPKLQRGGHTINMMIHDP